MEQSPLDEKLSLRDKALVTQKLWRLRTTEALGFVMDLVIPNASKGVSGTLNYVRERADLREDANAVNMSRYIMEKEIGSDYMRAHFEKIYQLELLGRSQSNNYEEYK